MSSLLDTLKSLKDKLSILESDIGVEDDVTVARKAKVYVPKDTEAKLAEVISLQGDYINIDASGKHYLLGRSTITNCKYPNILQESVQEREIHCDVSAHLFKYIAKIIRNFQKDSIYDETQKFKLFLESLSDKDQLLKAIEKVFLNQDILKEIELKVPGTEVRNQVNDLPTVIDYDQGNRAAYDYGGGYNY